MSMSITKEPSSFTVWAYQYDAASFHANELRADTFKCRNQAIRVARQRVRETNHNTGWAKIIDNCQAGHMGDRGVIAVFRKTRQGGTQTVYQR